jgi:hypothetical protein
MTITSTTLIRAAGVAAVAAGLIFIGVQINHPHADVANVTTTEWAVRNSLKILMGALALAGITGMYLRQVKQTGVLGLLGYLVFGVGYLLITSTTLVSACVLPSLAGTNPGYVNDVLAAATNGTAKGDIGLLQIVIKVQGFAGSQAAWSSASRCSAPVSWPAGRLCSSRSAAWSPSRSR